MVSRRDLIPYLPAMPDHVDYRPGVITGVDATTPILRDLYNKDPEELGPMMASQSRATSPNGAVWADKTILAQMVKAYNAKNGSLAIIADAPIATVSGWISRAANRLNIGRNQLMNMAKHAMLAAQSGTLPDSTPAE